jgi:hypothetical protein
MRLPADPHLDHLRRLWRRMAAMLPLGSVAVEPTINERGERLIWLDDRQADKLAAMRAPVEDYSAVILRIAGQERLPLDAGKTKLPLGAG